MMTVGVLASSHMDQYGAGNRKLEDVECVIYTAISGSLAKETPFWTLVSLGIQYLSQQIEFPPPESTSCPGPLHRMLMWFLRAKIKLLSWSC